MFTIGGLTRISIRSVIEYHQYPPIFSRFNKKSDATTRSMSSAPTYTAQYLIEKLQKELEADYVEVEDLSNPGCGMKFDAILVSPKFDGKPLLQRQRLVNQILVEELGHIHAFTMRTLTPDQWKESLGKDKHNES